MSEKGRKIECAGSDCVGWDEWRDPVREPREGAAVWERHPITGYKPKDPPEGDCGMKPPELNCGYPA
tara:strand:- start:1656 stop:1856 length:201 start_codon:yes stop_codon:yes gene_type:complete